MTAQMKAQMKAEMKAETIDTGTSKRIILASGSPRRLEILNKHGIEPLVMPSRADESLPLGTSMTEAVETLARRKAEACCEDIKDDPGLRDSLIIAADTIVWKDGIMGKPESEADAFRMLDAIRGTSHFVATGVCIIDTASGTTDVLSDVTEVFCKDYSDEDICEYLSMEEPYDKAGSYAIQGYFGRYIDHIEGDYENVVGLPFYRIEPFIKKR